MAEVLGVLAEDVDQAFRRRDAGRDGEAQADRMPGRRIRVLADDQHAHVVEGLLEGPEHVLGSGQVLPPRGDLGA